MKPQPCPHCKANINAVQASDGQPHPTEAGHVAICGHCKNFNYFDSDNVLQKMTPEKMFWFFENDRETYDFVVKLMYDIHTGRVLFIPGKGLFKVKATV